MKKNHISLLLKPVSSMCNMRCRYCFYSDISSIRDTHSYGIMPDDKKEKILDNIFFNSGSIEKITFAFQGGEPTLAGLSWFRHFIKCVDERKKNINVNYVIQTNGILLDDSWCEFFTENNFLVGLSIDVSRSYHDRNRLFPDGSGTFNVCMKSKNLLDKKNVEYNILCVLTNSLAKDPERAWSFIVNENIRYIQFIPCLEPLRNALNQKELSGNTLRPAFFAKFYISLLPRWIKEFEKGNYYSIKLFDDTINYFFKGLPTSCGIDGFCRNQYVVEADGSVYPCDFYAFDKYKTGNLCESGIGELSDSENAEFFLSEKPELPKICKSCSFFKMCRGGCKRMRNVMYAESSDILCGFKFFLEKCLKPLENCFKTINIESL